MRKINIRKALIVLAVLSTVSMVGCGKEKTKVNNESRIVKNVEEGKSNHLLLMDISASTDNGTGQYEENTINYKLVGENYYIGPKDYLVISDDEIIIYDRGGEQIVFCNDDDDNKFYSVKGLGVQGLYHDGKDVLLRCEDGYFYPINDDGEVSASPKENVKPITVDTRELEEMVRGNNKYVSILRVDEEGNFYTHEEIFMPGYDVQYFEHRICKYDKYGALEGYAIYYPDEFVAAPDKTVVVTENGNIYRMSCEKGDVKVYKVTLGTEDVSSLKSRTQALAESMNELHSNYSYYESLRDQYIMKANTPQLLVDVLLRNVNFIDTDANGKSTNMLVYREGYNPSGIWVLDIDKDGYNEVLTRNYGVDEFVVFRYEADRVYSYTIPSVHYLNKDGLMRDLSGAYFIPKFTTTGYSKKILAHSGKNSNEEIFYIGDKVVSYDTYAELTSVCDRYGDPYDVNYEYPIDAKILRLSNFRDLVYAQIRDEELKQQGQNVVIGYETGSLLPQEILDVFLFDKEFINVSNNNKLTKLSQLKPCRGGNLDTVVKVKDYIVVDTNWDGNCELIAYMDNSDINLFHYESGQVYCYNLEADSILNVSPDGYSHGIAGPWADQTIRYIFKNGQMMEFSFYVSFDSYVVDGYYVSKEEYEKKYEEVWGRGVMQKYDTLIMLAASLPNVNWVEDTNSTEDTDITKDTDETVRQKIADVILNDKEFIYINEFNKVTKLSEEAFDMKSYIVSDIDWDGTIEVVAYSDDPNEEIKVFYCKNGQVYCWSVRCDGIKYVSREGYLCGSMGEYEDAFYRLEYTSNGWYDVIPVCCKVFDVYCIGVKNVSFEEYKEKYDDMYSKGFYEKRENIAELLEETTN